MLRICALLLVCSVFVIYRIEAAWLDDCLVAHNQFRSGEGKPTLKINQTLCTHAQKRVDQLKCAFNHDGNKGSGYGENLAAGYQDCKASVKQWTDEKPLYDRSRPGWQPDAGHYTQVVWRDTLNVCCAMGPHCQYRYVTVCTYWKPGNVNTKEEFQRNV